MKGRHFLELQKGRRRRHRTRSRKKQELESHTIDDINGNQLMSTTPAESSRTIHVKLVNLCRLQRVGGDSAECHVMQSGANAVCTANTAVNASPK